MYGTIFVRYKGALHGKALGTSEIYSIVPMKIAVACFVVEGTCVVMRQ